MIHSTLGAEGVQRAEVRVLPEDQRQPGSRGREGGQEGRDGEGPRAEGTGAAAGRERLGGRAPLVGLGREEAAVTPARGFL